ncbi:hypothetical protein N7447_007942 [Penicillium robsamsonii]|uniref:uncharacterized protein n=1 Tax=Penicillium robsamsonii TaxID=1792511 RepID=UPI002548F707|nr:uncharacterized protein N7447_007942 [Penicillium robsamsonii]KAJ5817934.1 hypothetical protein N7447_007942 [Penicillium robsamsonii]
MIRSLSAKAENALDLARFTRTIIQKEHRVKAPGCAEVRRRTDRLTRQRPELQVGATRKAHRRNGGKGWAEGREQREVGAAMKGTS